MEEVTPRVVFSILGIPVTDVVTTTWIVMAIIVFVGWILTRSLSTKTSKMQVLLESLIEFYENIAVQVMGEEGKKFVPLAISIGLFILFSNWIEVIPGFHAPTRDLSTTIALAIVAVSSTYIAGIRKKGLHFFKKYIEPNPIFLPINILEELVRPVSLAFRLFGNVLGEEIVIAILVMIVPLILPIPMILLGLFTGLIQAFIFSLLTLLYVAGAVGEET
ncbi:MAG TPA: F0F1 ATP synthase subunit A [bacterium]|jgi:F-type H+-transporting ATPase subunit a|nr:F0F1 ATP synthase subunit A [Dictyoglomota bacterium]HHV80434.1 F0F1 ATP synthase subunit A [bacterium]HOK29351.1 F0F1 ATP synthase subunit A [bacterium]HOL54704.1 F0F1 ATP synthase subunit A [bacterium]HPO81757.1 F0F1 ATP synthase subunit A [bacterium]